MYELIFKKVLAGAGRIFVARKLFKAVPLLALLLITATTMHGQAASPSFSTPSSGSGSAQLFTAVYSDPNGGGDMAEGIFNIMFNVVPGAPGWSTHECLLRYDIATNAIWIVPDGGGAWSGPITAGSSGTLANSQCTVLASGSSAQISGSTVTVKLLVTFTAAFAGSKQIYMQAEDVRGAWSTNYQQIFGNFSVTATASPLSLVPTTGSGTDQVFSATYYNPNGGFQVAEADLYIMSNVAPGSVSGWSANECIFQYDIATNNIWQVIDGGGSYQGPIAAGGSGYLSNSQCTIFAAGSSAQVSGNTIKVNFEVSFTGANFTGSKQLYLGGEDTLGHWANNFNQQFGSWSIPAGQGNGPPSIPNSFTSGPPSLSCDNISGKWNSADSVGNVIGPWDLTESGSTITGTLAFDIYDDFGFGPTFCGTVNYSVAGSASGTSFTVTASNPNPTVDACGVPTPSMDTENVSLSGNSCSSGSATFTIGGGSPMPKMKSAAHTALRANAQAAQNTGPSTWSATTPRFSVQYASYIPVDNIHGPTPCQFLLGGQPILLLQLYKGDANRGTYRTTQSIFAVPDKQFQNNFLANAGPTRNYGFGSPINGSVLSSAPASSDIYNGPYTGSDEDNVQFDCLKWNNRGKADTSTMQGNSVSFPTSTQARLNLFGSGQYPLEPKVGGIKWNATITVDDANSSQPTASVDITHTCYPAHIVKVNGTPVYSYQPFFNNTVYLLSCLTVLPQIHGTASLTVPSH